MNNNIPDLDTTELEGALDGDQEEMVEQEEAEEEVQEGLEQEEEATSEKIKLGDQEYDPDELHELVGLGSRARDIGNSHGGFDKFVSEFGRKSQKIGELNKQLEDLQTAKQSGNTDLVEDELEKARQAAKKLGIVLKEDLDGYYQERRQAETLLENCTDLERQIDGSDGRPKFDTRSVLEFMAENPGYTDPEKAYTAMNMDKVVEWKAQKLSRVKRKGITETTSSGGRKEPPQQQINSDNLHQALSEALNV